MKILANRATKSGMKTIILGIIVAVLFGALMWFCVEDIGRSLALIVIVAMPVMCVRYHFYAKKFNEDPTPPVWAEGNNLFFYDGKTTVTVSCRNLKSVDGKNKKYFHYYGYFVTWGTYDYGKLVVRFVDDFGKQQKFVIQDVMQPEGAAKAVMDYQREILSGCISDTSN